MNIFSANICRIILLITVWSSTIVAQDAEVTKSKKTFWSYLGITPLDDTVVTHKNGLYCAPIVFYTPDTRVAAGIMGAYLFHVKNNEKLDDYARGSYLRFYVNRTQNKQKDLWLEWNVFTLREIYYLKGELRARNYPDYYFGIGNTSANNSEYYAYNLFTVKSLFLRKLAKDFFFGFDYNFNKQYKFKYATPGDLEAGKVVGHKGGKFSALGLVSIFDQRDNVLNPYKGNYLELSTYFYDKVIGSDFNFTVINGEYRKFWQIKKRCVLAFQSKARFSFGEVPF